MTRFLLLLAGSVVSLTVTMTAIAGPKPSATLTTAQIIKRNVAARGGLDAWRAVSTLSMSGDLEAGGKKNTELPFVMRMKRPHKSRLEIRFLDQKAIQVYDGTQGWKVRPFLGRDEVEPFTSAETKAAAAWEELDGPLIDHARKGIKVALQGMDTVEGNKAYKLKLKFKDGHERHLWIDAASFLEVKIDGEPRKMDGKFHDVAVYYRDYKSEQGLTVPHVFETVVKGVKQTHKMRIDHFSVNESMDDGLFAKPQLAMTAP